MSNREKIATMAIVALAKPGFERQPGYCKRWVRQVVEAATGGDVRLPVGIDARETYAWCTARGWALPAGEAGLPGDLLFKIAVGDGEHGHVGIRIAGNDVAENSSVHSHNGSDARGTRPLTSFGPVCHAVRIPG